MTYLAVSTQYRRVSDRWVDIRTDILRRRSPHLYTASRCENFQNRLTMAVGSWHCNWARDENCCAWHQFLSAELCRVAVSSKITDCCGYKTYNTFKLFYEL